MNSTNPSKFLLLSFAKGTLLLTSDGGILGAVAVVLVVLAFAVDPRCDDNAGLHVVVVVVRLVLKRVVDVVFVEIRLPGSSLQNLWLSSWASNRNLAKNFLEQNPHSNILATLEGNI